MLGSSLSLVLALSLQEPLELEAPTAARPLPPPLVAAAQELAQARSYRFARTQRTRTYVQQPSPDGSEWQEEFDWSAPAHQRNRWHAVDGSWSLLGFLQLSAAYGEAYRRGEELVFLHPERGWKRPLPFPTRTRILNREQSQERELLSGFERVRSPHRLFEGLADCLLDPELDASASSADERVYSGVLSALGRERFWISDPRQRREFDGDLSRRTHAAGPARASGRFEIHVRDGSLVRARFELESQLDEIQPARRYAHTLEFEFSGLNQTEVEPPEVVLRLFAD